jgi:hypothetical protein
MLPNLIDDGFSIGAASSELLAKKPPAPKLRPRNIFIMVNNVHY